MIGQALLKTQNKAGTVLQVPNSNECFKLYLKEERNGKYRKGEYQVRRWGVKNNLSVGQGDLTKFENLNSSVSNSSLSFQFISLKFHKKFEFEFPTPVYMSGYTSNF